MTFLRAAVALVGPAPDVAAVGCSYCRAVPGERCRYRDGRNLVHAVRADRGHRAQARHAALCAALADAAKYLDDGRTNGVARAAAGSRYRELVRLTRAAGLSYRLPTPDEVRAFALVNGWPAQANHAQDGALNGRG